MKTTINCYLRFLCFVALPSCSVLTPPTATSQSGKNGLLDGKNASADLVIVQRPMVSAETLNSDDLVLAGMGVGIVSSYTGRTLSVNYSMPKLADYTQLVRCRNDANTDVLRDLDIGTANRKIAWEKFLVKDYWTVALTHPNCITATEGFSKQGSASFFDYAAPSGNYNYVGRACVNKERYSGKMPESGFACSAWVGVSADSSGGYTNDKVGKELEAIANQQKRRDQMDALGRQAFYLAQKGELAANKCAKSDKDTEAAKNRKIASKKLLDGSIDTGNKIIDEIEGRNKKNDELLNPKTGNQTQQTAAQAPANQPIGAILKTVLPSALSLLGAFDYLYKKPEDFAVPGCPEHLAILEAGKVVKLQIDSLVAIYGEAMPANPEGATGTTTAEGQPKAQTKPDEVKKP